MALADVAAFVAYLAEAARNCLMPLSWKGLAFDLDILAEESGLLNACRTIARTHVDMMFHIVCVKGLRRANVVPLWIKTSLALTSGTFLRAVAADLRKSGLRSQTPVEWGPAGTGMTTLAGGGKLVGGSVRLFGDLDRQTLAQDGGYSMGSQRPDFAVMIAVVERLLRIAKTQCGAQKWV